MDALARREAKTRQKETEMGDQGIFCMHGHGQKMQHVGKDGLCAQRGTREGMKGNQGARSTLKYIKANEKQENKQGITRKRQNQDTEICQPKATNAIKNDDTKLAT